MKNNNPEEKDVLTDIGDKKKIQKDKNKLLYSGDPLKDKVEKPRLDEVVSSLN